MTETATSSLVLESGGSSSAGQGVGVRMVSGERLPVINLDRGRNLNRLPDSAGPDRGARQVRST